MNKLCVLLFLMFCHTMLYAQLWVGATTFLGYADITGGGAKRTNQPIVSFGLGASTQYYLKPNLSFSLETSYIQKGTYDTITNVRLHYIEIPLSVQYFWGEHQFRFKAAGGVSWAYLINAHNNFINVQEQFKKSDYCMLAELGVLYHLTAHQNVSIGFQISKSIFSITDVLKNYLVLNELKGVKISYMLKI